MTKGRAEAGALAAVCAGIVIVAWVRLGALAASPFPTGVDGYWYLIQIRSLLEHGRLHYPSAPLVPWLMAAAAPALGPVLAAKTVAALGSAGLVLPSYWIAKRVSGAVGPALLGTALVATSAQSFFLGTEFVKQAVGLALAMGFVASLAAWLERPGWARGVATIALLALCALTHKTAIALALLLAAVPVLARMGRWRLRLGGAAVVAAAVVATAFTDAPALVGHLFRATPDFSFAVLASPGRPALVLGREVGLAAGLALAALALTSLRKPASGARLPALAVGFVAFALLQALPWIDIADDQGLGYRLRLCACICLGPCAALVAGKLLEGQTPRRRAVLLALTIGLVLGLRSWRSEEGVIRPHPAMVEASSRLAGALPPGALVVIPERHTAFMAAWYGRARVRLRPPPGIDPARTFRLLPGAAVRPGLWAALDELRAHPVAGVAPSQDLHSLHPNGLALLPEPTFQYLLDRLPAAEREWYRAWPVQ